MNFLRMKELSIPRAIVIGAILISVSILVTGFLLLNRPIQIRGPIPTNIQQQMRTNSQTQERRIPTGERPAQVQNPTSTNERN